MRWNSASAITAAAAAASVANGAGIFTNFRNPLSQDDDDRRSNNKHHYPDIEQVAHEFEDVVESVIDAIVSMDPLPREAPLLTAGSNTAASSSGGGGAIDADLVPDSYIIILKGHIKGDAAVQHQEWVQSIHNERLAKRDADQLSFFANHGDNHGIKHSFNFGDKMSGYSGIFDEYVLSEIRASDDVLYVERDSVVRTNEKMTQKDAPWGLARTSSRDKLKLGNFNRYLYQSDAGTGVTSYVVDTGTYWEHHDFEGRASWGTTIPEGDADYDGNGHGTHCSGTIGGKKYGIAKKAHIVAVKVLRSNGSGTMSDVIKGVEYVAEQHMQAVKNKKKGYRGTTANMSLGGGRSPSLDLAVNAAVEAGVNFAVAAGNDNADACDYSPAASKKAVTVGASTVQDVRAYFSNYGKCVDIFGPGYQILSTYIGSPYATATLSGTSMASPHVAGLLTYFLSLAPSSKSGYKGAPITPLKLKRNIVAHASTGVLSDVPSDTPNKLIYNGGGNNVSDIVIQGGEDQDDTLNVESIIDSYEFLINEARSLGLSADGAEYQQMLLDLLK